MITPAGPAPVETAVIHRKEKGGEPATVTVGDFAAAALQLTPARSADLASLLHYHVLIGSDLYEATAVGRVLLDGEPVNPQRVIEAARAVGLPVFGRVRFQATGRTHALTEDQLRGLTY